jgi:hypothetical protein
VFKLQIHQRSFRLFGSEQEQETDFALNRLWQPIQYIPDRWIAPRDDHLLKIGIDYADADRRRILAANVDLGLGVVGPIFPLENIVDLLHPGIDLFLCG